ncbi:non-hydrolyzing UDP-N-acetylglucosamine 2-epimerase [Sutcliffiella sp. NC1]|uniref:non-hydrolyzing UDP-N-acetylglucosamine 2-epimerase n=1 Tax=Sutcliffiella sp. NC1 TaxID=3004096 RepID=UPI0022DD1D17|nr:UDP-N-acetylglucosamine 2-epimerase (non-hydrolyzing) [Sutcliffiella sp. NC1]WBL16290.1 UDP-N-acetylglucosamine 2-epimerase (non-hydrolyzing) [Sutcliffiella sp. NC1]
MKIAIVVGTRPELIKMAPLIKEMKKRDNKHLFIHSGQHYDYYMDGMVLDIFELAKPDYNLQVGSGSHSMMTANMMMQLEKIILKENVDKIVVHGDTNTTLAGGLTAAKMNIPVAHVEAGLRSKDKSMPEEINRIIVDHLSSYLLSPTADAINNLKKENISSGIHLVGQTIVDSIDWLNHINHYDVLTKFNLKHKGYFFITVHRQENTNDLMKLQSIIRAIKQMTLLENYQVVLSLHPRTKKIIQENNMLQQLSIDKLLILDPPPNFYETIQLQKHAKVVVTDSGGLQEESCIVNTPCVTLRENTERPETVKCGANIIAGYQVENIMKAINDSLLKSTNWKSPYGEPGVGSNIMDIITERK